MSSIRHIQPPNIGGRSTCNACFSLVCYTTTFQICIAHLSRVLGGSYPEWLAHIHVEELLGPVAEQQLCLHLDSKHDSILGRVERQHKCVTLCGGRQGASWGREWSMYGMPSVGDRPMRRSWWCMQHSDSCCWQGHKGRGCPLSRLTIYTSIEATNHRTGLDH